MIFDEIPYDDSNQNEIYNENTNHEILLQQLKNLATAQEAKIYSTFNQDWKAQLDPQVRQWMTQVRYSTRISDFMARFIYNKKYNTQLINSICSYYFTCQLIVMDPYIHIHSFIKQKNLLSIPTFLNSVQHYFETQKKSQKVISNIQLESYSSDHQTADISLDDYFQL